LQFLETLKQMHANKKTVIVATHDPIFEELNIDYRVIQITDGKIV